MPCNVHLCWLFLVYSLWRVVLVCACGLYSVDDAMTIQLNPSIIVYSQYSEISSLPTNISWKTPFNIVAILLYLLL